MPTSSSQSQLKLLPESPERDLRELELASSVGRMLQLTKGWAAPETAEANERAAVLLEKSGGSEGIGNSLASRAFTAYISGDYNAAGALLDQALELALRNANPTTLAYRYMLQVLVHYQRGRLAGAENQFTRGLPFFDDPASKMILSEVLRRRLVPQLGTRGFLAEPRLLGNGLPH